MVDRNTLVGQTKLAFDFIHKLYLESSYLIKEIEGLLLEEKEKFKICKPGGYGVATRSSSGLEPVYVNLWLMRKFAVAFIPEEAPVSENWQTKTKLSKDLKILYVRIVLDENNIIEPFINSGYLTNFETKQPAEKWGGVFEKMMNHLAINDQKIFVETEVVNYEDTYVKFSGRFIEANLYDLNESRDVYDKIIVPTLRLFRTGEINS